MRSFLTEAVLEEPGRLLNGLLLVFFWCSFELKNKKGLKRIA